MSSTYRIKRRWTGAVGAPSTMLSGELAYNGLDDTLYLGYGDDGAGNATSIKAIGGDGIIVTLTGAQTIAGIKTFSSSPIVPTLSPGDNSTKVASTAYVDAAVTGGTLGAQSAFTTLANNTSGSAVPTAVTAANMKVMLSLDQVNNTTDAAKPVSTATTTALALKANLAGPTFTGVPAAATATLGTNTTQLSTTAFVQAAVAALINGAPGTLNTLKELADAINDDASYATTLTTALATKLTAASNLSDVASAATARTNLGLGTMATQAAGAVAITGGTIDGVIIDGGVF